MFASRLLFLVSLAFVLMASPEAQADPATTAEASAPAESAVKVSLSAENPDVQAMDSDADLIDFYVWIDGQAAAGAEFGLALEGAECQDFVMAHDDRHHWMALPMSDPYPGTIAQILTGKQCAEAPVCLGRLVAKPNTPGGKVTVDVIPSLRAAHASLVNCDYTTKDGVMTYSAVANGGDDAPKSYFVQGEPMTGSGSTEEPHRHPHDESGTGDDAGSGD